MTNSILYDGTLNKLKSDFEKGKFSKEFNNYGCCAFLARSKNPMVGVVPTNYVAFNKDVSEDFEKWIDFLSRNLKVDLNYFVKEMPFSGVYSANATNKILDSMDKELLRTPATKVNPFSYISERDRTQTFKVEIDKVICNGYFNKLKEKIKPSCSASTSDDGVMYLRYPNKSGSSYDNKTVSLKEHLSKPSKVYFVEIPKPKEPHYNPFRLLLWTFIRDFYSNHTLIKFLLEKEDLIKEYLSPEIGWMALYSFLRDQVGGSYFLYNIQKFPYNYSDLERIADEIVETFKFNKSRFTESQFMIYSYLGMYSFLHEADKVANYHPEYGDSSNKVGYTTDKANRQYNKPLTKQILDKLYSLDTRAGTRRIKEKNTSYTLPEDFCKKIFKALDIFKELTTKHAI